MKKFFKRLIFALGILMIICIIAAIIGLLFVGTKMKSNQISCTDCILEIKVNQDFSEKSKQLNPILKLLGEEDQLSFREALELIDIAADDENIKAISINGSSYMSFSQSKELAESIKKFKEKSNKDVFAYGDYYTQSAYILSTQADSTFIHPMGSLNITGFRAVLSFYKEALDKWDVKMSIYKAGKYKGFTESYSRNSPSPENEEQYRELIDGLHNQLVTYLANEKGNDVSFWENVIAKNLGARAQSAIDEKLIHAISYETDYLQKIKSKYNKKTSNFLPLMQYKSRAKLTSKKANVAYVVMEGAIGIQDADISSEILKKELKKIYESDDYKAVVLRVNSGGGSAFASDDIWHEVEKIKNKGIPVIASIGNVAASGGYYVLMNSNKIFANENSIVGSIGVFILFPEIGEALEKHVGINHTKFSTSPYSSNPDFLVELSPEMKAKYQKETDFIYDTFISKVAEGRGMDKEAVNEIAQGRIYIGSKAKEIGLVDDFMNLSEIMEYLKTEYDLPYVALDEFPKESSDDLPGSLGLINAKYLTNEELSFLKSSQIIEAKTLFENSLKLEPRMELVGISIR